MLVEYEGYPSVAEIDTELAPALIFGQDPYVLSDSGCYYLYQSVCTSPDESHVTVRVAEDLYRIFESNPQVVNSDGEYSKQLWAPEVHYIHGKYYMYFTAVDETIITPTPLTDNQRHRMYVSESDSPLGPFGNTKELFDPEHHYWGIDMTVLALKEGDDQQLFAIWSGWEGMSDNVGIEYHINGNGDLRQLIYIARMDNATQITPSTTRILACPREEWEGSINEGPQIMTDNSDRIWLFYSAGESWKKRYCQRAMLLVGSNPTESSSWQTFPNHFFCKNIGHVSFVKQTDGRNAMFYHSKSRDEDGWNDRTIDFTQIDEDDNLLPVLRK